MTSQDFIKTKPYLVWSTKEYDKLSDSAILEAILNYGDWEDVQQIIDILGIQKAATLFRQGVEKARCNYKPKIKNYFELYFNKYA